MFDKSKLSRVSDWMQGYVNAGKLPGASVLLHASGQEHYVATCGRRDVVNDLPFARDTVVRLYSMTKPVTSAILMMLIEEGRLHLDAPLSNILPEFKNMHALRPDAERIDQTEPCPSPSLHQCLTHTSGLSYAFNPGVVPQKMNDTELYFASSQGELQDLTARLSDLPLAFKPGQRWEYSVGIDVIGRVIEVVEDAPLDAVFQRRILDPLGMKDTGFSVQANQTERFACLYTPLAGDAMDLNAAQKGNDPLRLVEGGTESAFFSTSCFSGGGGLVGTLDDYMKFANFLHTGRSGADRLLSSSTLNFMMRNHLPGDIASMGPSSFAEQPMNGMGFGIGGAVVLDPARARTIGNTGDFSWGGMASTFFWIDRQLGLSVVFLTQLSPSSSYPLRSQLKALVHGALL